MVLSYRLRLTLVVIAAATMLHIHAFGLRRHKCYIHPSSSFLRLSRTLAAGKGFGSTAPEPFPSIDAIAKGGLQQTSPGVLPGPLMSDIQANSGGGAEPGKVFEKLNFPTSFTFKIIGSNEPTFTDDCLSKIAGILKVESRQIKHTAKLTNNNKYVSITCSPVFSSPQQIYATYAALSKEADSRIKFVL